MPGFSDTMETELLNYILRGTALSTLSSNSSPASLYAALHTADPTDAGSGSEASYTNYARVALSRASGTWTAPTNSGGAMLTDNVAAITFPAPGSGPQTVTHLAIWSASTSGTLIVSGALAASRVLNNGDAAPTVAIGDLDITLA